MKSQETNSLRSVLAAGELDGNHPDAGVLSAFAEGGLIARERQEVLAHLATCGACREVLSLTADSEESSRVENATDKLVVMARPESRRIWRSPLVGIAASLIVAASAGLFYERSRQVGRGVSIGTAEQQVAVNREPIYEPKPAAEIEPRSPSPSALREVGPAGLAGPAVAKKERADRQEERRAAKQETVTPLGVSRAAPIDPLEPKEAREALQADLRTAASTQVNARVVTPASDLAPAPAPVLALPKSPKSGLATSNAAALHGAASGFVNRRASGANGLGSGHARPRWRIDESGRVERSFGNDEWQVMLPDEHLKMRVISVSGGEVWVGGDDLRLYHSGDNGGTWQSVALPSGEKEPGGRAQAGVRAIVHIVFQTPLSGFVQAEDGTEWTTSDGGSRWGRVN